MEPPGRRIHASPCLEHSRATGLVHAVERESDQAAVGSLRLPRGQHRAADPGHGAQVRPGAPRPRRPVELNRLRPATQGNAHSITVMSTWTVAVTSAAAHSGAGISAAVDEIRHPPAGSLTVRSDRNCR